MLIYSGSFCGETYPWSITLTSSLLGQRGCVTVGYTLGDLSDPVVSVDYINCYDFMGYLQRVYVDTQ